MNGPMQAAPAATQGVGAKHDAGKRRWMLMPWAQLEFVVRALEHGSREHGDYNWQSVEPKSRYVDSAFRHLIAYARGHKTDAGTGLPHLACVICNCLFLMWADGDGEESSDGDQ